MAVAVMLTKNEEKIYYYLIAAHDDHVMVLGHCRASLHIRGKDVKVMCLLLRRGGFWF